MPTSLLAVPEIDAIRARFPALAGNFAFLENAGGSQVPHDVPDAVAGYYRSIYVQLGAGYPQSREATDVVERAHGFGAVLTNTAEQDRVVLGPSTTALTHILAGAYGETLRAGDEIIVAETNHEANAGPWARLERFGAKVKIWRVAPATFECELADLDGLLTERTRIVAVPHVSNLLGHVTDIAEIARRVHQVGARLVVDGVAYAPHRAIDAPAHGADWYVFSMYKVYGPHMAILYGKGDAFDEVTGPNHFFLPRDSVYKFELGGVSHEACAGMLGVAPYLAFLTGADAPDRPAVEAAFARMRELERPLQERIVRYLEGKADVRIIGKGSGDHSRVGTISFVSDRLASDRITAHTDQRAIGIRHGHMYAYRLCEALGISTDPGVVRISLVHYNTSEEVDRLLEALEEIL